MGISLLWSDECGSGFLRLKKILTTTPILSLPLEVDRFIVHCVALRSGMSFDPMKSSYCLCL